MDPTTPVADFNRLAQYGAIGVVAAGLLTLVVLIFRQLVNHVLKQSETVTNRQHEMELKLLESIHATGQAIRDLDATIKHWKVEIIHDVAAMVREEVTEAGSRAHRLPRKT